MSHIIREDGQRFVIPSYRDVLSSKKISLLKKEILMLSKSYGEYVTLQKKNANQIEVAFSPEPGLLFGETAWNYFKRPRDLLYCEEIPNTNEALLVIVKAGSVYLDGTFPLDSISDELVVFQTEKNNFDIFIFGNIPISQTQEEGKFTLDASSVKSFTVLDRSAFAKFPTYPQCDLKLVDNAIKGLGLGTFPVKKIVTALVIFMMVIFGLKLIFSYEEEIPAPFIQVVNPYQGYFTALSSPSPFIELQALSSKIARLYTIPGWIIQRISYQNGLTSAAVKSIGARTSVLFDWASKNRAKVTVKPEGFFVNIPSVGINRPAPTMIYQSESVIGNIIDRLSFVLPGNILKIGTVVDRGKYTETELTIRFENISPTTFGLIGQQLKGLPINLAGVEITMKEKNLSGSIQLTVLGN